MLNTIVSSFGVYRELILKIIAKACSSYHFLESIGNSHSMHNMRIINHVNSFSSKKKKFHEHPYHKEIMGTHKTHVSKA